MMVGLFQDFLEFKQWMQHLFYSSKFNFCFNLKTGGHSAFFGLTGFHMFEGCCVWCSSVTIQEMCVTLFRNYFFIKQWVMLLGLPCECGLQRAAAAFSSFVRQREALPWVPGQLSHSFSSPDQDVKTVGTCLDQGILIALEFTPLCLVGSLWTLLFKRRKQLLEKFVF